MPPLQPIDPCHLDLIQGASALGYSAGWTLRAIYESFRPPSDEALTYATTHLL